MNEQLGIPQKHKHAAHWAQPITRPAG